MDRPVLRIHQMIAESRANGPGNRAVLWVQGCSLGCPGCFNPETHPFKRGRSVTAPELLNEIVPWIEKIEGLTISGGEPFQQGRSLAVFLHLVRTLTTLSVVVFSGYRLEELEKIRYAQEAMQYIDVLIAGRFEQDHRLATGLKGSANKTIHLLTSRYTLADLEQTPAGEVLIDPNGDIHLTGIDPITWLPTKTDPTA